LIARRIRLERIGAQLATIISLLVIEIGRFCGEGIRTEVLQGFGIEVTVTEPRLHVTEPAGLAELLAI
jgi:hypothetical protein